MAVGNLVLETTNRKPGVLAVVDQGSIDVAVAQVHEVRAVASDLSRTPEDREVALVEEIPIVVPVASRQRREGVGVRPVPAACRLEHLASR